MRRISRMILVTAGYNFRMWKKNMRVIAAFLLAFILCFMLSLSEKALLTDGWWIILIPGAFLIVTLLAITGIGDYLRKELNKKESYL